MIRSILLAATAALTLSVAAPGVARAQEAVAAPAFVGLTPDAVRDWLAAAGAQAGPVSRDGQDVYFRVDDGGVVWFVFFYSCEADGRCGDMQFNSVFDGRGVSLETVNAWNREQRFPKAFLADANGVPVAFLQYDVLFLSGQPVGQLADATVLWLEGIAGFGQHLRAALPAAPTP